MCGAFTRPVATCDLRATKPALDMRALANPASVFLALLKRRRQAGKVTLATALSGSRPHRYTAVH
eukprot:COSAG03_NODE_3578_length_1938_cov_2.176183_3_plen_64_part_01